MNRQNGSEGCTVLLKERMTASNKELSAITADIRLATNKFTRRTLIGMGRDFDSSRVIAIKPSIVMIAINTIDRATMKAVNPGPSDTSFVIPLEFEIF